MILDREVEQPFGRKGVCTRSGIRANAKLIFVGKGDKVRYSIETVARCAADDKQPGGL